MLQAFVRDPDGYYIEFCNCNKLEDFLHKKMEEDVKKYNFTTTSAALHIGSKLKEFSDDTKLQLKHSNWKVYFLYYV